MNATNEAREAVLMRLILAHDHHVTVEREAWMNGNQPEAEGAHRVATWLLRAYAAERDDPAPAKREPGWSS